MSETETFLEHHGIKGMRWGQRRAQRREQMRQHAQSLVEEALKDPKRAVVLNGRHVITGKQFIDHLAGGGLMDIKTTVVYKEHLNPKAVYAVGNNGSLLVSQLPKPKVSK